MGKFGAQRLQLETITSWKIFWAIFPHTWQHNCLFPVGELSSLFPKPEVLLFKANTLAQFWGFGGTFQTCYLPAQGEFESSERNLQDVLRIGSTTILFFITPRTMSKRRYSTGYYIMASMVFIMSQHRNH